MPPESAHPRGGVTPGTPARTEVPFQLLVESIEDYAIFMLDPAGNVASWNAGARRLKGYRADEILGSHFSRFYPVESRRAGWPEHELKEATAHGRFEDEGWRIRKDGSRFWASVLITALRNPDGELVGYAKVTRDMTAVKRIEALEASERRMSEFLAMLSHELRNPLAPIRTMVDLFKTRELHDPQLEMIRNVIDNQVMHLTRVVSDLLDIARIQHGLIAVRRGVVDVSDVVSHAVQSVRPLIEEKEHHLHIIGADQPLHVEGDVVRLSQVLVNLLNNAATFTPPGGDIRIDVVRDGADAVISVSDNGRGIDSARLPELFTMFSGPSQRHRSDDGGLGLGLGLVKRLVELHDGRVEARSEGIGRGSTFIVRLPLLPDSAQAAPVQPSGSDSAPAPLAEPAGGGVRNEAASRRILIVDDNRDFADSLGMLLETMGHEVKVVHRGKQAVEVANDYVPDVVLLDIGLPDIDGYEVAQRMRAGAVKPFVLAALTGWGQESDKQAAAAAGFDHHLVKPVELEALEAVLDDGNAAPKEP